MKITKNLDGSITTDIDMKDIKDILGVIPLSPLKNFLKRNSKDKIGILIGITTEEKDERNRVDNDLIREVNNSLKTDSFLAGLFNIIKLEENESKSIDNHNYVKILEKYRSHLIIFGHVAKRNNQSSYSLKLEAGVRHRPIPRVVSNLLSSEFASLFPRQRFIPTNDDLLGFEITAKEIALVAQYMIGVALFVSGFLGYSFKILSLLNEKLNSITDKSISSLDQLKQKNRDRISNVSLAICSFLYDTYAIKRNIESIRGSKMYIDVLNTNGANEKVVKNLESIYYFLIEKNVDKAISVYESIDDPMKPYNLGFLCFFKGDVKQGLAYYKRAFKRDVPKRALLEMEIFINETLENYPEKYELLFARGLINYKGKEDFKLAKEDFSDFIKQAYSNTQYEQLRKLALIYKIEAQKKL